jgi:hypothetical protein
MHKGKESKQIVDNHVADFLYENRTSLHRPSYYDARVPWLERVVNMTSELRMKHEEVISSWTLTLIEREDDTRSWGNFLIYFSHNTIPT